MKAVILALLLNAHALGNNEVWQELDDRFSQLPEYMMDQIIAAAESGLTGADVVRTYISHFNNQYQFALQQRLYYRLTDTTEYFTQDSAFSLLFAAEGPRSLALMCQLLLASGNYDWQEAFETKLNNFNGNDAYRNALEDWYYWYMENAQNDESYFEMESSIAEVLQDWIYYTGSIGAKAMGILELKGELHYEEPVLIPIDVDNKKGATKPKLISSTLRIQPNPAKDYTSIYYRSDKIIERKEIVLMNLQGNVVLRRSVTLSEDQVAISVSEFPNGTYVVGLYVNGQIVATEKLIILK